MDFRPTVGAILSIDNTNYKFTEHPVAMGMPYGQSGRRATVYQIVDENGKFYAIKIFTQAFRDPRVADGVELLKPYAEMPGLEVCERYVLTPQNSPDLIEEFENLNYSVVMPWIYGETWQEFLLGGKSITKEESVAIARSFANILGCMEEKGISHGDLSGPNVLMPGLSSFNNGNTQNSLVALVDVEDLYAPEFEQPEKLPGGSAGYAHKTSEAGIWGEESDRFSGAVLLSEMLGWSNEEVRQLSCGEQYFDLDEMQANSDRYQVLLNALKSDHGSKYADLLAKAWESETLQDCPKLGEWADFLGDPTLDDTKLFQSTTPQAAKKAKAKKKEETPQEKLVRSAIERAETYESIGQTDRAIQELEEAQRIIPDIGGKALANALLRRGSGRERTGDLDGALEDYRRALSVSPPGGLRDELESIVDEVVHKIELARGSIAVKVNQCPNCQKELLPNAEHCPYCGISLREEKVVEAPVVEEPKKRSKTLLVIGIIFAFIVLCTGGLGGAYLIDPDLFDIGSWGILPYTPTPVVPPTTTPTITPTPVPGIEVIPISQMQNKIPWLEMDDAQIPASYYIVFNSRIAPYDNVLIRQALSAAVDRDAIALLFEGGRPATNITPPEVIGVDLYNQAGINYDLNNARALLTQAGYHNAVGLPELTLVVFGTSEENRNVKVANAMADMWSIIGIDAKVEMVSDVDVYNDLVDNGKAGMIFRGWIADYIDPDNFLKTLFFSSSPDNVGFFADAEFDQLISDAGKAIPPEERQSKYIQAEVVLCDKQAGTIPLVHSTYDGSDTTEQAATEAPTTDFEFYDDFSDASSGWDSYNGAEADYGYHEGETYFIETSASNYWARAIPPLDSSWDTTDIAVGFSAITPESLTGEFGVWCRYTDYDNKYEVAISPEAVAYQISKTINGRTTVLTNPSWKVINNYTLTKINEMAVSCSDNEIALYVNDFDEPVEFVTDGSITQGNVALYIESGDLKSNTVFKVLFHDFIAAVP